MTNMILFGVEKIYYEIYLKFIKSLLENLHEIFMNVSSWISH